MQSSGTCVQGADTGPAIRRRPQSTAESPAVGLRAARTDALGRDHRYGDHWEEAVADRQTRTPGCGINFRPHATDAARKMQEGYPDRCARAHSVVRRGCRELDHLHAARIRRSARDGQQEGREAHPQARDVRERCRGQRSDERSKGSAHVYDALVLRRQRQKLWRRSLATLESGENVFGPIELWRQHSALHEGILALLPEGILKGEEDLNVDPLKSCATSL